MWIRVFVGGGEKIQTSWIWRRARLECEGEMAMAAGCGMKCGVWARNGSVVVAPVVRRVVVAAASRDRKREGASRRDVVALLVAICSLDCNAAGLAWSPEIAGPKEWLKEQKKKTSGFLLAPILASKEQLRRAASLLNEGEGVTSATYREARELVRKASRDCMAAEAGFLVDLQSRSGIQVCTYRLILKNASSLLQKDDAVRLKAEASLDELIRWLNRADALLMDGAAGNAVDRARVWRAVKASRVALEEVEGGVRRCLGVADPPCFLGVHCQGPDGSG